MNDPLYRFGLGTSEQGALGRRLIVDLAGALLLGVGVLWSTRVAHGEEVGQLFQSFAAALVGFPAIWRAARGLGGRHPADPKDQLVGIAVLAAWVDGRFGTAALLPAVADLGRVLEERGVLGFQSALSALRKLLATQARRIAPDDQGEEAVSPDTLQPGDKIRVGPGEIVPADGTIQTGQARVDESALTGETHLAELGPGDAVREGALNLDGLLDVVVTARSEEGVVRRIEASLQAIGASQGKAYRLLDRAAEAWLPVVLSIAAMILYFTESPERAIGVLVAAVPTGLVLAVPATLVASLNAATRLGILVRSPSFLEGSFNIDIVLLDKTGTLTEGRPRLLAPLPAEGIPATELLAVAAACARGSSHPVAQAARAAAEADQISPTPAHDHREQRGLGVEAQSPEGLLRMGRASWLRDNGVFLPEPLPEAGVYLARDNRYLGGLQVSDHLRPDAAAALSGLRARGVRQVIALTGDRQEEAERIAEALSVQGARLDGLLAGVLPEEKQAVVRERRKHGRVMMIGDGVNDALALAEADIGVAFGERLHQVAVGGADVALFGDALDRVNQLMDLGQRTRRILIQNLLLAALFSLLTTGLAAAGLLAPLAAAIAAQVGGFAVLINAARLLPRSPPPSYQEQHWQEAKAN
jgi:Cd2+/Zn2+-exporting ATPase